MFNLLPTIFYHSAQLGEKTWGGKTGGKTGDTQKLPSIRLCRFKLMTLARNASVPVDSTVDSTSPSGVELSKRQSSLGPSFLGSLVIDSQFSIC